MKTTVLKVLIPFFIFSLLMSLSSCLFFSPMQYDTHTVTINLPDSQGRFVSATEAQSYTRYYEIRLYKYLNGIIMDKPVLTKVLTGTDLSFTCDTGLYYLEVDGWAEETGTVVTGRGSTKNTESFDDGIQVTPGVFELSSNQLTASVTVEMHTASEEEYPVWNINWNLNGGKWEPGYIPESTFDWRRMYPLEGTDISMSAFPSQDHLSRMNGDQPDSFFGWYLTPTFSDSPITSYQQLPLQDVTLYARWASASGITSDTLYDEGIEFSLAITSGNLDTLNVKTVEATPSTDWPDTVTFTWLLDGEELSSFNFDSECTFDCPIGIHTVTCIATAGNKSGTQSITVVYKEN